VIFNSKYTAGTGGSQYYVTGFLIKFAGGLQEGKGVKSGVSQ